MLIIRKSCWYRPYYMVASGREYKIERIHFYKDNAILVSTNNGWLEKQNGEDIESLELPIDEIKVKRKENFNGEIFAISKGKESYGVDLLAELYIPADMFGIHFVEHKIMYNSQVRAIFEGEQGIYITSYVKSLDGHLNAIRNEYEETYKRVSDTYLSIHKAENVLADIDRLKKLAEEFIAERKRIHGLTIDDIEL